MTDNTDFETYKINKEIYNICNKNKFILQLFDDNNKDEIHYYKSITDIAKRLNIPYNVLINIYYICNNRGGGKNKNVKKRYIHSKYKVLLQTIRIFDQCNEHLLDDKEYFKELLI